MNLKIRRENFEGIMFKDLNNELTGATIGVREFSLDHRLSEGRSRPLRSRKR